jgi:hypothetical protein
VKNARQRRITLLVEQVEKRRQRFPFADGWPSHMAHRKQRGERVGAARAQNVAVDDVDLLRRLLADLHDDLFGKLARFRQLTPLNLSRRVIDSQRPAEHHLLSDASFAISMAVRLLALPSFRLSGRTILDEDI